MINFNTVPGSLTQAPIVRETGRITPAPVGSRFAGDERVPATPEIHVRSADSVDISALARRLAELPRDVPVRQDLVDRVRAEIESGAYETADKLEIATERLLGELDVLG